jgi:hypothetical protein
MAIPKGRTINYEEKVEPAPFTGPDWPLGFASTGISPFHVPLILTEWSQKEALLGPTQEIAHLTLEALKWELG